MLGSGAEVEAVTDQSGGSTGGQREWPQDAPGPETPKPTRGSQASPVTQLQSSEGAPGAGPSPVVADGQSSPGHSPYHGTKDPWPWRGQRHLTGISTQPAQVQTPTCSFHVSPTGAPSTSILPAARAKPWSLF